MQYLPKQFSNITKFLVVILMVTTFGVVWQSITVALSPHGTVAGVVTSNASVEPNPYNTLNQQLENKAAVLRQQEIDLLTTQHQRDRRIMSYLFTIAGALLILIVINFYLDYRRNGGRSQQRRNFVKV